MQDRLPALLICALLTFTSVSNRSSVAAQQSTPTVSPTTATSLPTVAPSPPSITPTMIPEPTLTDAQAIEQVANGEQPVVTLFILLGQRPWQSILGLLLLGLVLYSARELFRRWANRGIDAVDSMIGGKRHDIEKEIHHEEIKQTVAAERAVEKIEQQTKTALHHYLLRLEKEMLRLAKIPALGREQRELDLEQVYVQLYVVEREQMEYFSRYSLGDFGEMDELKAREGAYAVVQESRPVFRLLSEQEQLPQLETDLEAQGRLATNRQRSVGRLRDEQPTTERLLLIGRAGSGKTTTLHYGTLILARAIRTGDTTEIRTGLQLFTRSGLFPIYARLTEVMTYVREHYAERRAELVGAPARLLLDALDELAKRDVPELTTGMLGKKIKTGGCLVMLDGLDETGDVDERGWAMDLITSLVRGYPKNRYLVASRPFEGLRERLQDFTDHHLRPLNANDIRRLLNKLFIALRLPEKREIGIDGNPDVLVPEAAELWHNLERSPRLFDMATNPLLLTSMAVLVEGREPLPVERAKIYEKLVQLTIEAWRKAQLSRDRPGVRVRLYYDERYDSEESNDSVRLRLQLLAANMLEQERREITLVQARDLLRPIYRENNPSWNDERCDNYIRELLYQIALHSGLLQARDSDSLFSFTHFTLQEYLAARHYTEQRSAKPEHVVALMARWLERRWRETILLAIGHEATSGSRDTAKDMLDTLLLTGDPEALLLAGNALDEANARTVGELTQQRLAICERLRYLAALTNTWDRDAHPDPVLRNRAATLLDRLNADNHRRSLDLTQRDYWAARIEPGTFSLGDNTSKLNYTIRRPYALARFPVTNRQYLLFIEALAGRGTAKAVAAAQNLALLMREHKQIPEQFRPRYWPSSRYRAGEGHHPVVGISWYAATAFAWWANEVFLDAEQRTRGEAIRLPTEAEWERAAAYPTILRSGNTRAKRCEYPWGNWNGPTEIIGDRITTSMPANTAESRIGGTSVVGIFPHGAAACGAEELAGNVWEWCSTPPVDYRFENDVNPESLYGKHSDVSGSYTLRGGSWDRTWEAARCGLRGTLTPDFDFDGFRLVRLFPLSSS